MLFGELNHLEVNGDETFFGEDEVVGFGIDDDDTVIGAIPAEVGGWDGAEAFLDEGVVDDFIGGDCAALIPLLVNDEGGFADGLPDDETGLVGDEDAFQVDVSAEDLELEGHPGEVFGWAGVAAVEVTVFGSGDLAEDAGPSVFDSAVGFLAVEDFVLARAV